MNILNRITGFILVASFAGLALGATNSDNPPQHAVHYADLDLNRTTGAQTLLLRIKSAAREVCEPQQSGVLAARPRYQKCIHEAIGRAVADVDAPVLAAVYGEKSVQ